MKATIKHIIKLEVDGIDLEVTPKQFVELYEEMLVIYNDNYEQITRKVEEEDNLKL